MTEQEPRPHIITAEEILQRATAENRSPLSEDEITAMNAEITDGMNSKLEDLGEPLPESYHPYKWRVMHEPGKDPVYIAEGALNCLAFEALGLAAAEYRTGLHEAFVQDLESLPPSRPLIIALSRDTNNLKTEKLYNALQSRKIECYKVNPYGKCKNAAEALETDPEAFRAEALRILSDPKRAQHLERSAAGYIDSFLNEIRESVNNPPVSTGFNAFDRLIGGGLRPGLTVIMAMPNIGKSAFVLQIADQIAAYSKKDVLYCSLEMSRSDHMARSISRQTYAESIRRNDRSAARSATEITDGFLYQNYTEIQKSTIAAAIDNYRKYADHLYFMCGSQITFKQIEQAVYTHKAITGSAPVVIVDYLQIIVPDDPKADQKSNTDRNITKLVNLGKSNKTPVIAISSVNRMSYKGSLSMSSAKESGGVEFGCDVLLAMQYRDQNEKTNFAEEKARYPRQIEFEIHKNRYGRNDGKTYFNYYPKYNTFGETT